VTKSPEERLSALEEAFVSLKEGMSRVEKGVGKLEETFAVLMDKLDSRYPSKESVELRLKEQMDDIVELKVKNAKMEKGIEELRKYIYKAIGGTAVGAFLFGFVAKTYFHL